MKRIAIFHLLFVGLSLCMTPLLSKAQEQAVVKATCQFVGNGSVEPIGDRDGHGILVHDYSCIDVGGVADGAILTGTSIAETEKGGNVTVSGNGILRKPGGIAVFVIVDQQTALTMTSGKVSGFTGTARGIYKLAAGNLASLAGKSYTSEYHSISAGQFLITLKMD